MCMKVVLGHEQNVQIFKYYSSFTLNIQMLIFKINHYFEKRKMLVKQLKKESQCSK